MNSKTRYRNGKLKVKNTNNIKYEYDFLKNDIEESKAFKKFVRSKIGFKKESQDTYLSHITTYCYFHQEQIEQLINKYKKNQKNLNEDETEEDLEVNYDIIDYANHAIDNKQAKATIQNKVKRISHFLRKNGVTVPKIDVKLTHYDDSGGYFTKKDLPDKETMQTVISDAKPRYKAIFSFMYTTGSGRAETANLTVESFIEGLKEFTEEKEPREIIKKLDGNIKNEVPLIKMTRQKTGKPYYTCCTGECAQFIIDYIKTDLSILDNLKGRLFGVGREAISSRFLAFNTKNSWGKRGWNNFFSAHRLRHNHYTQIQNTTLANALEGRVNTDAIDSSYNHALDDPDYLRDQYKDHMFKFEIFDTYNVAVRDEELQKLQKENEKLRKRLETVEIGIDDMKKDLELYDMNPNTLKSNTIQNKIQNYLYDNQTELDIATEDIPILIQLSTNIALNHEKIYNNGNGIKEVIKKAQFELKLDKTLYNKIQKNLEEDNTITLHLQDIASAVLKYVEENELYDVIGGQHEDAKLTGYLLDYKEKYAKSEITDELITEVIKEVMYYDDVDYGYGE